VTRESFVIAVFQAPLQLKALETTKRIVIALLSKDLISITLQRNDAITRNTASSPPPKLRG